MLIEPYSSCSYTVFIVVFFVTNKNDNYAYDQKSYFSVLEWRLIHGIKSGRSLFYLQQSNIKLYTKPHTNRNSFIVSWRFIKCSIITLIQYVYVIDKESIDTLVKPKLEYILQHYMVQVYKKFHSEIITMTSSTNTGWSTKNVPKFGTKQYNT